MNLADNLKKIRKDNNLSQEALADKLGVSRQSVSKWESGLAYPEMDKVIAICKMFNLNIDELLNQDIKEVNEVKQKNSTINKYIEDFLAYITKTVDMFSSMKFWQIMKCLLEQTFIAFVLFIVFSIIGSFGNMILYDVLRIFPDKIGWFLHSIISDIYILFAFIFSVMMMLHIFKIRYLDYYLFVKEEKEVDSIKIDESINDNKNCDDKINIVYLKKKQEKIVIRDPENSGYRFISGLLKCILFIFKIFVGFIFVAFCFSLIAFVASLVLSFLFLKTGLMFIGAFLIIISCIVINIILLISLYNFIISRKNKLKILFLTFISALILFGIGCGICAIAVTDFDIIDSEPIVEEKIIPMNDKLVFEYYYPSSFVETNSNDVKIVSKHSKYYKTSISIDDNIVSIYYSFNDKHMNVIKEQIKSINDKHITVYQDYETIIYTSKENIEKIKSNNDAYYENMYSYEE